MGPFLRATREVMADAKTTPRKPVKEDLTEQFNLTLLFSKLKDVTIPMLLIFTSANELLTCTKLPTQQKAPPEPFGDVLPLHTVTPELFVLSSRETFLQRALVPLSELCFTQVVSNFTQIKGSLCELAGIFVLKKE